MAPKKASRAARTCADSLPHPAAPTRSSTRRGPLIIVTYSRRGPYQVKIIFEPDGVFDTQEQRQLWLGQPEIGERKTGGGGAHHVGHALLDRDVPDAWPGHPVHREVARQLERRGYTN